MSLDSEFKSYTKRCRQCKNSIERHCPDWSFLAQNGQLNVSPVFRKIEVSPILLLCFKDELIQGSPWFNFCLFCRRSNKVISVLAPCSIDISSDTVNILRKQESPSQVISTHVRKEGPFKYLPLVYRTFRIWLDTLGN